MKIYKCDVCGRFFDPKQEKYSSTAESPINMPYLSGVAMSGIDVCQSCADICKTVDFKTAMLREWKRAVLEGDSK